MSDYNKDGKNGNNQVTIFPDNFKVDETGIYYQTDSSPSDNAGKGYWLCDKIDIFAYTRNEYDKNNGLLIGWKNKNSGIYHKWAMPLRLTRSSNSSDIIPKLVDEGLSVNYGNKVIQKLMEFFNRVKPVNELISVSNIGWHGKYYVFPDRTIPEGSNLVLQSEDYLFSELDISGTLGEWQDNLAIYAKDNPYLIDGLINAFASPCLAYTNISTKIINLVNISSKGKSTALKFASSVYWKPSHGNFIKQWRNTGNAQEALLAAYRDCMLPLDEFKQADPKTIEDMIYTIANEEGKGRMNSSAILKENYKWRTIVYSSAEHTVNEILQEIGQEATGGVEVRCIDIQAEANSGHGIFEELHGFDNGHQLAEYLGKVSDEFYGPAFLDFIEKLANCDSHEITNYIEQFQNQFINEHLPKNSDGQLYRVGNFFAFKAAVGELAIYFGTLPNSPNENRKLYFEEGSAYDAISRCFKDHLKLRGTSKGSELLKAKAKIRESIAKYGDTKFARVTSNGPVLNQSSQDRMGFKREDQNELFYDFFCGDFNKIISGFHKQAITKGLVKEGYLEPRSSKHKPKNITVKGESYTVYRIRASISNDEELETDEDNYGKI